MTRASSTPVGHLRVGSLPVSGSGTSAFATDLAPTGRRLVSDVIAELFLTGRFTTIQLNCLEAALIANYSSDEIILLSRSSTATPALLGRYTNDTQRCLGQR